MIRLLLFWTAVPSLLYFIVINVSYGLLVLLGWWEVRRSARRRSVLDLAETATAPVSLGLTVVIPAYNEGLVIEQSVRSTLALDYPDHEVVVVNDGSTDDTLEALTRAFDLVPSARTVDTSGQVQVRGAIRGVYRARDRSTPLVVLDTDNSGRSDSVNAGICIAAKDLVVFMDADSVLDHDALLLAVQPFLDDPVRVVATGGSIRAVNGCRVLAGRVTKVGLPTSWLARLQVVEYLRAFSLGRAGWSMIGALMLISGAFGVYRRDVLLTVGGLDADTIGEDFELAMAVHRWYRRSKRDYRMVYVSEPVSWTEVPDTGKVLRKQRARWHRGLWEVLWKYRGMLLNPRYGRIGMIGLPYYWLFELCAPLFEVFGLVVLVAAMATGAVNPVLLLSMLGISLGIGVLVSVAAILLEELSFHRTPTWRSVWLLIVCAFVENFGYRQFTAVWRLEGWWKALRRTKQEWGVMSRTGFSS
ncbi:glycosyltransferase family 2 protein [Tessaracoccus sp. SD287]|uniref:glycosyltransferase family 2 protein n=1 Tax=Tessaracoccus sp. SD287 TaxID=2782008 RepID=UPI001A96404A|nr:glycosyltransferase [Tessaracoccus sp. SD287]MBO1031109.1 glycosyltransferase family 2 protein [Tessaracoccus sp. SD287]